MKKPVKCTDYHRIRSALRVLCVSCSAAAVAAVAATFVYVFGCVLLLLRRRRLFFVYSFKMNERKNRHSTAMWYTIVFTARASHVFCLAQLCAIVSCLLQHIGHQHKCAHNSIVRACMREGDEASKRACKQPNEWQCEYACGLSLSRFQRCLLGLFVFSE